MVFSSAGIQTPFVNIPAGVFKHACICYILCVSLPALSIVSCTILPSSCSHILFLVTSYSGIDFMLFYLFSQRSWVPAPSPCSYLYSPFSLLDPVTICCGKAQFPDRDHLVSLRKARLAGLQRASSLYDNVLHPRLDGFDFLPPKTMRCQVLDLVRGMNGRRNELWHRSMRIVSVFWAPPPD